MAEEVFTSPETDLVLFDALKLKFRELRLHKDPLCPICSENPTQRELVDYEQLSLLPLPGAGVPPRQELSIEGTVAGLAYRRVEPTHTARPGSGAPSRTSGPLTKLSPRTAQFTPLKWDVSALAGAAVCVHVGLY